MSDSLAIKIEILQRPYSVRVKREEEEIFRQAGKFIEESIQRYANKGAMYRDKQDLLAMALLESTIVALKMKKKQENNKSEERIYNKLKEMDDFLVSNVK